MSRSVSCICPLCTAYAAHCTALKASAVGPDDGLVELIARRIVRRVHGGLTRRTELQRAVTSSRENREWRAQGRTDSLFAAALERAVANRQVMTTGRPGAPILPAT